MKTIKMRLSHSSIQDTIRQLEEYRDALPSKCQKACNELAFYGISVARMNLGEFGSYIVFSMEVGNIPGVQTASVVMGDSSQIAVTWKRYGKDITKEISPTLFTEFGSGKFNYRGNAPAESGTIFPTAVGKRDYGRGSFPEQSHAFDKDGWWYKDTSGKWHHSYGYRPKAPLYFAYLEITKRAIEVTRSVFANG